MLHKYYNSYQFPIIYNVNINTLSMRVIIDPISWWANCPFFNLKLLLIKQITFAIVSIFAISKTTVCYTIENSRMILRDYRQI